MQHNLVSAEEIARDGLIFAHVLDVAKSNLEFGNHCRGRALYFYHNGVIFSNSNAKSLFTATGI